MKREIASPDAVAPGKHFVDCIPADAARIGRVLIAASLRVNALLEQFLDAVIDFDRLTAVRYTAGQGIDQPRPVRPEAAANRLRTALPLDT